MVYANLAIPFQRASAQQWGHAKPGDALLVCQCSTGGGRPKLGDELWRASAPHGSRAKPSGQRSIGSCTKPGDAPLTGQCSTEELR